MANSNQGAERSLWDRINPVPRVQAMGRNIRAHPFQTAGAFAANAFMPGAGPALMQLFKPFNAMRDNSRAQNFDQNTAMPQIQGVNNRLSQQLMGGRSQGGQGNQLADAMRVYGGQGAMNSGQYNMSAQQQPNGYDAIMGSVPSTGVGSVNLSGLDAALAGRGGGGPGQQFGMSPGSGMSGFGMSALGSMFNGSPISAMGSIRSGTSMGGGSMGSMNQPGMRGKVKLQE